MIRYLYSAAVLFVLLLASCSSGNPTPTPPGGPGGPGSALAEPFVVKGSVTDSQGHPLEGVEVFADNTAYYDMNIYGVTGANGAYRIELGDIIPSSWRVGAYLEREFHGETFRHSLHPDDSAAFAGVNGAIRNLDWRLSGEAPEGGYYGALVYVYEADFGSTLDMEFVEISLVPVGSLIDGSAGEAIVRRLDRGIELTDIPLGNYRVTARSVPADGPAVELLIRLRDNGEYAPSVTSPFANTDYYGPLLSLEVKTP